MDSPTKRVRGEMQDCVGLRGTHCGQNIAVDFRFAQNKFSAGIDGGTMSFDQIIVDGHLMTGIQEFLRANRADVTGAASDENIHTPSLKILRRH